MARPRKQTYTLEMYLKKVKKGDIDNNADVQRNFVWNNEQINELVVTVLTDDYIPPIILGEEENSKLHIVDGGCRTAALRKFKEMNYKITSSIENSLIPYNKKVVGEDGTVTYEEAIFDIKNKTYEKLPEELQEKFDEYQIETVIHEHCDSSKISKYIKRYNNHVAMNTDQKAFTYIDRFASRIRKILNSKFFVECNTYSEKDKTKGVVERIVIETMMCMNHFDDWKKQPKAACKYLNENATEEEFERFSENLCRLEKIVTDDIKNIFNKKDSFIFLSLFDRFTKLQCTKLQCTKLEIEDIKFVEFLKEFDKNFRPNKRNDKGMLFDEIDKDLSTKDKQVITDKLNMLEKLMLEFLHINSEETDVPVSDESFIAEVLDMDVKTVLDDMDFYNETLDELEDRTIKVGSRLLNEQNRLSLLTMLIWAFNEDVDLEGWLTDYASKNNSYFVDSKKNFIHMKQDYKQYCMKNRKIA